MFISKVKIRNFRKFNDKGIELSLKKGLNVLIGENNIGKTAIIDALRLAFSSWQYRKDIYVKKEDFHVDDFGNIADKIIIDIFFENLNEEQKVSFYQLLYEEGISKAHLCIGYFLQLNSKGEYKIVEKVGKDENFTLIDKEVLDNIRVLYLQAIRDVELSLKPSQKSTLSILLNKTIKDSAEREKIIENLYNANSAILNDSNIKFIQDSINSNLKSIEKDFLAQKVLINLLDPTFESISGSLGLSFVSSFQKRKIKKDKFLEILEKLSINLEDIKDKYNDLGEYYELNLCSIEEDDTLSELYSSIISDKSFRVSLSRNGLGYNNLLSMAMLMSSLKNDVGNEFFSTFLIEEPEAHLHPQLLDLVLEYFENSSNDENIQVIITSHSPVLVSRAKLNDINIISEDSKKSISIALKNVNLESDEVLTLERYLDVTKSRFLFAKRCIFVEGITEGMLLSEFAKKIGYPLNEYSIEIVNINGVSFEPFVKLFKYDSSKPDKIYLKNKIAIITDDDRCTDDNTDDKYKISKEELKTGNFNAESICEKLKKGKISNRAKKVNEFSAENVFVGLAYKTLEYEIANIETNNDILLKVLSEEHPTLTANIKSAIQNRTNQSIVAVMFWNAIRDCKGTFAQKLANEIGKNELPFEVPKYISDVIKEMVKN